MIAREKMHYLPSVIIVYLNYFELYMPLFIIKSRSYLPGKDYN